VSYLDNSKTSLVLSWYQFLSWLVCSVGWYFVYGQRGSKMTLEGLRTQRETIQAIARSHGAHSLRIFGSVVRGEADAKSDVDFLVELEPGRSLLDLGGLLMDLQEHLSCKVDVMTPAMLKPRIRDRILREATPL